MTKLAKKWLRGFACACLLGSSGILFFAQAHAFDTQSNRSNKPLQRQQVAQKKRLELQQKLTQLKQSISQTQVQKKSTAQALEHTRKTLTATTMRLQKMAWERQKNQIDFEDLTQQQRQLLVKLKLQMAGLAESVRANYKVPSPFMPSRMFPHEETRLEKYRQAFFGAHARLVEKRRQQLDGLKKDRIKTQALGENLEQRLVRQTQQKKNLENETQQHAGLLEQLNGKLRVQQTEMNKLARDQQRLADLVDQLSKQIAQQKKQRARHKKLRSKASSDVIALDKKTQVGSEDASVGGSDVNDVFEGSFAQLKGRLHWPVRGELVTRFGSRKNDGPSSKGVFIQANAGAVKAVAPGRIVFADQLRGFGKLIIVDHGNQYLTIYGNNQTLVKNVGDVVKAGEVLAYVGNNEDNQQPGLYFEMRHAGQAFNPFTWME